MHLEAATADRLQVGLRQSSFLGSSTLPSIFIEYSTKYSTKPEVDNK